MTLPHAHLLAAKVSLSYHRLRAYRMLALMSIFDAIFNFLLFALVCEVGVEIPPPRSPPH